MTIKNQSDLFVHTLKDILYAEHQIAIALPKIIGKTGDGKLRGLFEDHLDETNRHVSRLKRAFAVLNENAEGVKCPAIDGIIDEAVELMSEIEDPDTRDAGLIAAMQAVEHYEITRYGTLCVWAKQLGHIEVKNLLEETLSEEKDADDKLTQIAENSINTKAFV
ncbi:ferritin-like domain-containing protein [Maritalea sp.]|uniref:YciE/YciF ferroxidase family protein n=1 Tax=Maritalea sp. TaxID=2003361 RepID=UPI003EF7456A